MIGGSGLWQGLHLQGLQLLLVAWILLTTRPLPLLLVPLLCGHARIRAWAAAVRPLCYAALHFLHGLRQSTRMACRTVTICVAPEQP